ncbi:MULTISPECIES: hypothetical protein [Desulfovibrionaceae]|jgi:hypothetical protein|nr:MULTISPECIES: hypothetical protein [Desulfovibrionaceae]ABM29549.1 conserved hypothetical protein [Nitratidesulfovibrio vulgaris DP4]ADP85534.1 hypothetical protein Deval_0363 [Nitratidesulfovibrio vulgaris RCH1]WCB47110.1 hypothetical protein PH214_03255 [Nitratidesulfovibrio vulgaris]GEB80064.1 hypothetical protein DDE01_14790 [Desulfovibrio desulfuricans]
MQDERGLYYYPDPTNRRARVYVRVTDGAIEFRLWQADHAEVWDKHGWIPLEVIRNAAAMYRDMGRETDPMLLYDEAVARALLKEAGSL